MVERLLKSEEFPYYALGSSHCITYICCGRHVGYGNAINKIVSLVTDDVFRLTANILYGLLYHFTDLVFSEPSSGYHVKHFGIPMIHQLLLILRKGFRGLGRLNIDHNTFIYDHGIFVPQRYLPVIFVNGKPKLLYPVFNCFIARNFPSIPPKQKEINSKIFTTVRNLQLVRA